MFKRYVLLLTSLAILLHSAFLFAENSFSENIDFVILNTPSENGNRTLVQFRLSYNNSLSSSIYFTYDKRVETSSFLNRDQSIYVSKNIDKIFDVFPFEYSLKTLNDLLNFRFGIGMCVVNSALLEDGYFITSPDNPFHPLVPENATKNHIFTNEANTKFYTAKVRFEFKLNLSEGNLNIWNRLEYIPVYYMVHEQTMNITPLVSNGPISNEYRGISFPYIMNEVKIHVAKLIEIQYQIEYQKLSYELIGLNYSNNNWVLVVNEENKYTIHNQSFSINLRPMLFNDFDPIIGVGKKWFNTKNDTTSEVLVDENEWLFNIGLITKKF